MQRRTPRLSLFPGARRPRAAGFTLIELSVSLLVMTFVLLGILALFDSTRQLATTQLARADMQQSLRIAQRDMTDTVRLAGRGGLPASNDTAALTLPTGLAIRVDNNVAARTILVGQASPTVVPGTDVLAVRGVIDTPVYLVEYADPASFTLDTAMDTGQVVIRNVTPIGGVAQDFEPFNDLMANLLPEAIILVSPFSDEVYGVAELTGVANGPLAGQITLDFRYGNNARATAYALGSSGGVFPETVLSQSRVGTVGILEEYRFYVRQGFQIESNPPQGAPVRRLSRARTYPGLEEAYNGDATNLAVDISENILDFQVALGFDTDGDGQIFESADGSGDEWLGNNAGDDPASAAWTPVLAGTAPALSTLRLSSLARAAEPQRNNQSPLLIDVEDHDYAPTDPLNDFGERLFQRFVMQTIVDLRNL